MSGAKSYDIATGSLLHWLMEVESGIVLWEICGQYLPKFNVHIQFDPEMPLVGIFATEMSACVYQKLCTRMFIAYLIIGAKTRNNPNI